MNVPLQELAYNMGLGSGVGLTGCHSNLASRLLKLIWGLSFPLHNWLLKRIIKKQTFHLDISLFWIMKSSMKNGGGFQGRITIIIFTSTSSIVYNLLKLRKVVQNDPFSCPGRVHDVVSTVAQNRQTKQWLTHFTG